MSNEDDAWEQFKEKQNVLAKEMHREWEKLKQYQAAFDFSVFELPNKGDDGPEFSVGWVEPGSSGEFDPCSEEHYCEYVGDAISVVKRYIEEFPNRTTGNWSFSNPTEEPCLNVAKAFGAYALDYHLHNGKWPTEFKCNGKVYSDDWCWAQGLVLFDTKFLEEFDGRY